MKKMMKPFALLLGMLMLLSALTGCGSQATAPAAAPAADTAADTAEAAEEAPAADAE